MIYGSTFNHKKQNIVFGLFEQNHADFEFTVLTEAFLPFTFTQFDFHRRF